MKQCRKCQLAFDSLNAENLCESCAPVQQADPEKDALKRQLAESDQRFQMLQSSMQQAQRGAQPSPDEQTRAMNARYYANPVQATAEMASAIAQQAVGTALANDHETIVGVAVSQARESFDSEMREYFDKYQSEIRQQMTQYAPQYHRNSNVWKNIASAVIGAHVREIMHDQKEKESAGQAKAPAIRINDGPAAPSTRAAAASSSREEALSPEALQIARRLDLTEAQMRQGIKDFENQNDDPTKPSSWDRAMTFDSKTGWNAKRRAEAERRAS